jgi:hypothetical protein
VVRFERVGGASGVIAVVAIAIQFLLVGTTAPDAGALVDHRARWEWVTLLRVVGGIGITWFTAGLAGRLRRWTHQPTGPARVVLGAGLLWGAVWLISAAFNSAALSLPIAYGDPAAVHLLGVLGAQSVLVLTPALSIAFLVATGAAVLAAPTFPRRFAHAAFWAAGFRFVLALVDWHGDADVVMRIMDFTLMWVVVTSVHLLGATRPAELAR